jgi:hypothetical protein
MSEPSEIRPERQSPWGAIGRSITRVTASIAMGSGTVGNTTFGLWAVAIAGAAIAMTFVICGYPVYGLVGLGLCILWYLVYQAVTWIGIAKSPDAGMTGERHYVDVVVARQGARDASILISSQPILAIGENVQASQGGRGNE